MSKHAKIFVTGATGYIGGDALFAVIQAHPEYDITCLVRNSSKGALVVKDYPSIKLVYGDLDSVDLIEAESKKADIVLSESRGSRSSVSAFARKPLLTHSHQTAPTPTTSPPHAPSSRAFKPTTLPTLASSSTRAARASC